MTTEPELNRIELEIHAMADAYNTLCRLNADECARALWWLRERLERDHRHTETKGPNAVTQSRAEVELPW